MNEYHVTIEPSKHGGYLVSITGPGIPLAAVEHVETVEEGRAWASAHVLWLRTKDEPVRYVL